MSLLREDALAIGREDVLLGSEDELARRTGVSRPTLRQALRILEYEELLSPRRGVKGGIYTRTPGVGAVAGAASAYLRAHHATLDQSNVASGVVSGELAKIAATTATVEDRAGLVAWVDAYQARDRSDEARWMLPIVLEFGRRVGDLAGNETLKLFSAVLHEFAYAPLGFRLVGDPAGADVVRVYHREASAAILAGDGEAARAATLRHQSQVAGRLQAWEQATHDAPRSRPRQAAIKRRSTTSSKRSP
ncbi:MAG: FCD domain-containing protein [Ilumatobacteraceae bacterium]